MYAAWNIMFIASVYALNVRSLHEYVEYDVNECQECKNTETF